MKEVPKAIYSDGITGTLLQDRDHFVGQNIDHLFREALKGFAQSRIDSREEVLYDHRLLDAAKRDQLTPGLIDRYLECRQIYHVSIMVNNEGKFTSKFSWAIPSPNFT